MKKKEEFNTQLTWEEEQSGSYILRTEVFEEIEKLREKYKNQIMNDLLKAKKILREVLGVRESFTYKELLDKIEKAGGIFRVTPNVPIKDFLKELEEKKIIYYNEEDERYYFVDKI